MGLVYAKDKPEAESFSYAYVEAADGSFVRISVDKMREVLKINTTTETTVTLSADGWNVSSDGAYYTQDLTIEGTTSNSKVDLDPTPTQIIQLMNEEVTLFVANEGGVITAYAINATPSTDITLNAKVTEVLS